jgi:HK97 gp10 family phage protein
VANKYRGSSVKRGNFVEMYGVSDLLKQIEAAGGNVDAAVQKAVDKSLEIVGDKMQTFMLGHKDSGDTYGSFEKTPTKIEGGKVTALVGYNAKKGGLPAIFLDVGTPKIKPHFFRYYAVENSRKQVEEIQQETLNEILRGLR